MQLADERHRQVRGSLLLGEHLVEVLRLPEVRNLDREVVRGEEIVRPVSIWRRGGQVNNRRSGTKGDKKEVKMISDVV